VTTVPRDAIIGRLVDGRYEVLERIARGGMATVYRAIDRRLDRDVAVKVMHPHLAESEDFVSRFRREARAAARLSHPHVVGVFDQGMWEDSFYLTMEYVDGHDLRSELRVDGALTLERALAVTQSVLDALASAHRRGLVHRDIKPENFLVSDEGDVKLIDFALARRSRGLLGRLLVPRSKVQGTKSYMAPEQIRGKALDQRADLYSLACTLYELVSGRPPFAAPSVKQLLSKHLNSPPPPLEAANRRVTPEFAQLIRWAMSKNPADRPRSTQEFFERIRQTPIFWRTLE